jgi:hypothetical protein
MTEQPLAKARRTLEATSRQIDNVRRQVASTVEQAYLRAVADAVEQGERARRTACAQRELLLHALRPQPAEHVFMRAPFAKVQFPGGRRRGQGAEAPASGTAEAPRPSTSGRDEPRSHPVRPHEYLHETAIFEVRSAAGPAQLAKRWCFCAWESVLELDVLCMRCDEPFECYLCYKLVMLAFADAVRSISPASARALILTLH